MIKGSLKPYPVLFKLITYNDPVVANLKPQPASIREEINPPQAVFPKRVYATFHNRFR